MNKDRRLSILLVIGIVALVFLLSRQFFFRIDLTEDHEFTMSKATKSILKGLDDPVDVKAYFSGNLPADFELVKNDFQNLLVEYNNISKGKINYRFIDPGKDQALEQEAVQNGIQPLLINVREKDEASQKKAYMGAIVQYGDQKEVIPFINQGSAMEYDLTTAIKKITVKDKPAIAFVQGHGEPDFNKMPQTIQELSVIYNVESLDLSKEPEIAQRYQAVILVNPADSIPPDQYAKISDYLTKGGKVFVAVNAVNGDLSTASGSIINTSVIPWLATYGINIDPTFIVDASCAKVTVQQQRSSFFSFSSQINFPYLPLVSKFPDHPATKGLEAVIFQFASPIKFSASASGSFIPLVTTSAKAGTQQAPLMFDVNKQWTNQDFPLSNLVIGGLLEGAGGNAESKLVVFSDGDFFVSEQGKVNPDNVSLVVNTIDWMCDKSGLAELRTKGVVYRPIKDLEEGKRTFIKYLNFLLPLILVVAVGIWRTQRSRNIRMRRMQEKYS
jgi:gliding-associated putative ABC transporter substrate-binding component GldG